MSSGLESTIKDLVTALKHNTWANLKAIQEIYNYRQFDEANKVPPVWQPSTVLLPGNMSGNDPLNVFPRNPKRSGFVLLNNATSTGSVMFGSRPFNISEYVATLASTGQGKVDVGILAPGQSSTIVASGPLFVATTGSLPATLTVIETLYMEISQDAPHLSAAQVAKPKVLVQGDDIIHEVGTLV